MLKKSLSFLLLFFLIGVLFTACGKSEESSENKIEETSENSIASNATATKNDDASDYQNQLVGAWYIDPQIARVTNGEGLLCILYDDGSCEIDGNK